MNHSTKSVKSVPGIVYSADRTGIQRRLPPVAHRDDEYDSDAFATLKEMQERHFWYQGRHRFLLRAMHGATRDMQRPAAIDFGGGCGGWVRYLQLHSKTAFRELALADSSLDALTLAGPTIGKKANRYQIDLLELGWQERWDVAFLLDVLEHIPQHVEVMQEIAEALTPGGVLLVTTPAIPAFWTYNDDLAHHVRRYTRSDFQTLAAACGLELELSRYFMFFLSPLLLASRWKRPDIENMTAAEITEHLRKTHAVPHPLVNTPLRWIFSAETPLGLSIPFPWGTSILGVFRKPAAPSR